MPQPAATSWSPVFALAEQGRLPVIELLNAVEKMQADHSTPLAISLYRTWLASNESPLAYAVWFNLGVMLADAGQHPAAADAYRHAIELRGDFLPARFNLGTAQEKLGQPEAALEVWRAVLELAPAVLAADQATHKLVLNNLGRLLEVRHQYREAEAYLKQSLVFDREQPDVVQHWLHLRQKQCAWPLLADWPGPDPERALDSASALSSLALTDDPAVQREAARRFIAKRLNPVRTRLAGRAGYAHRRLRIGYLSGDFCLHPVALLMIELFELHDREQFEIYGYCWSPEDGSGMRQRLLAALDHLVRIDGLDDEAAARRIRDDEIDILVDLQGLTSGARPNLLGWRPAPVQIAYLGFPGTTGHPEIDYLLADEYLVPAAQAAHYSEQPLYLPDCFQPSDRRRELAPPPTRGECGLPENGFVFCCFNNNYKITPEIFAAWMRILEAVPGSVLWLLADNPPARDNLLAAAGRHGIDPARLIFVGRAAPPVYLSRYRLADLFLDTTPFNAGTTANDALWQGLPLLTLSGRAFASRMAGSLLHTLGLDELVCASLADYQARAIEIARAPDRLAALRARLEAARASSPLFDMNRLSGNLEALYRRVAAPDAAGSRRRQRFLHVGCGAQQKENTLPVFNDGDWDEIRLDIDPAARPDILGSMTDLSGLADGSVDAVFSSHNIEHLYPHEVPIALREFRRVLGDDGFAVITCPDLQSVCALVAANRLTEPAYISPSGPIAPLDILYGLRTAIAQGQHGMAHRTGFTRDSLQAALREAGFGSVAVIARPEHYDLWAVATARVFSQDEWLALTRRVIG